MAFETRISLPRDFRRKNWLAQRGVAGSVAAAEPADGGLVALAGGAKLALGEHLGAPVSAARSFLAKLTAEPDDLPQFGNVVYCELNGGWK